MSLELAVLSLRYAVSGNSLKILDNFPSSSCKRSITPFACGCSEGCGILVVLISSNSPPLSQDMNSGSA